MYGPYSDKTLMRNVLLYTLAEKLGWYGPRTRFIELTLNGDYKGIYVLVEKIKIDEERVDIANLTQNDTIGDELTGGYIIRVDRKEGEGWYSNYSSNVYFEYYDPDEDQLLEVQKNYIKDFINSFEYQLDIATGLSDTSLLNLFNVDSFIDYIILNELSKNVDAYRLSTYMYKDKNINDGRLKMGPVWDYNIAFGNNFNYEAYTPEDFIYDNPLWEPFAVFWFRKLMSLDSFQTMVISNWNELRSSSLHIDSIYSIIDSSYALLAEAQERNFERWPILGVQIWPNYYVGETYLEDVDFLKEWLSSRTDWLDVNFPALYTQTELKTADNNSLNVTLFPNPFEDLITITLRNCTNKKLTFSLFDMVGRKVFQTQFITKPFGQNKYQINLTDLKLENAMYIYKIGNLNSTIERGKIIKKGF
ncbi:MAG: CotH kinase family protein [Bacteroidales bacterium]